MPQSSATRTFAVRERLVDLGPYDLRSATSVTLHSGDDAEVLVADTDYMLDPIGGDELTGTYLLVRLAEHVSLDSTFSGHFGVAKLTVVGAWGVWNDTASVPEDLNAAAIETVSSWLDRGVNEVVGADVLAPRAPTVKASGSWDIPVNAHRKFALYARDLNVF